MSNKTFISESESFMQQLLDLLTFYEGAVTSQHRSEFFNVFRNAYEAGYCHPLRYYDYKDTGRIEPIYSRPLIDLEYFWSFAQKHDWVDSEMNENDVRCRELIRLMEWWDQWTFAWVKLQYKIRVHKNIDNDPQRTSSD